MREGPVVTGCGMKKMVGEEDATASKNLNVKSRENIKNICLAYTILL